MYASALGYVGKEQEAEKEFLKMKSKFSNYEARYQFALFLVRANRLDEAQQLLADMMNEWSHLTSRERNSSRQWFQLAKIELQKLQNTAKV